MNNEEFLEELEQLQGIVDEMKENVQQMKKKYPGQDAVIKAAENEIKELEKQLSEGRRAYRIMQMMDSASPGDPEISKALDSLLDLAADLDPEAGSKLS